VDSALQEKVKVTFEHLGQRHEVHELRQMELEVFNSHPRQQIIDKTITIHLNSEKVTILGVTAANMNNQTPELGGRKIVTRVEQVPTAPPDLLLGTTAQSFYPALVIHVPYLDKITENDRVFLRITYNGPSLLPKVQGAEFKHSRDYYTRQKTILTSSIFVFSLISFYFMLLALRSEGIPLFYGFNVYTNPYYIVGTILIITTMLMFTYIYTVKERWLRKWMRTLPNPLIPPPYEPEELKKLYFHDTQTNVTGQTPPS